VISGHGPQAPDGSFAEPLGKLGREVSLEQGYASARLTALSILGSLKRSLGDLDRVAGWSRVFGMVNSAPASTSSRASSTASLISFSKCSVPKWVAHSRSAVGMAELPFNIPVEIEGEVELIAGR